MSGSTLPAREGLVALAAALDDVARIPGIAGAVARTERRAAFVRAASSAEGRAALHALIEGLVPAFPTHKHEGRDLRAVLHAVVDAVRASVEEAPQASRPESGLTVLKYVLVPTPASSVVAVPMPRGAKVLHAAMQREDICVWVVADLSRPVEPRELIVVGTGHPLPAYDRYVGTTLSPGGTFVFHVFEREP